MQVSYNCRILVVSRNLPRHENGYTYMVATAPAAAPQAVRFDDPILSVLFTAPWDCNGQKAEALART